jgi:hypothetical protein
VWRDFRSNAVAFNLKQLSETDVPLVEQRRLDMEMLHRFGWSEEEVRWLRACIAAYLAKRLPAPQQGQLASWFLAKFRRKSGKQGRSAG